MPITDVQPPKNPGDKYTWGFDTEKQDWVPVDRQALEGSKSLLGTIQNLGLAAGRGFENVGLGLAQMGGLDVGDSLANLQARQAAAGAAAPTAEGVGGFAPEALAAIGAGTLTGGLGALPALGLESAAAGAVSGLRPGSFEERIAQAAESAGLTAVGSVAGKGILAALGVGARLILPSAQKTVARGVEAAGTRAATRDMLETAAPDEGAPAAGPEPPAQGPWADTGQARAAGAQATPTSEFDPEFATEAELLKRSETTGAESVRLDQIKQRAQELDMKVPDFAGTPSMSPARLWAAAKEGLPFGDIGGNVIADHNKMRVGQIAGEALDLPEVAKSGQLWSHDLDDARAQLGLKFDQVRAQMPAIDNGQFVKAMQTISQDKGPFGKAAGQKIVQDAIDAANAEPGGKINGQQFMQSRSLLSGKMADLYNAGDISSGNTIRDVINKLDQLAQDRMKATRQDFLANKYATARTQWQVLTMLDRPGATNPATGEINWRSVFNGMRRAKTKGGFGGRPGDPMQRLYDALEVQGVAQTQVPFTGARMLAWQQMAPQMRQNIGRAGTGIAGGVGLYGASNLWGD